MDFYAFFQHDVINALTGAGMAQRWLSHAHSYLDITLICRPFVCNLISSTFGIPFRTVPPVERKSSVWIEHLVFAIPPFGEENNTDSWEGYPCGTLVPFFGKYNRVPFAPSSPLRLLLVSRDNGVVNHRPLVNEAQLIERLTDRFPSPHFSLETFVHNDAHPEKDAIAFQSADVILGLHGGALTNMVYSRRGTIVVEMSVPEEGGRQCFAYVSYNLGMRYHRYGMDAGAYVRYTPKERFFSSPVIVNAVQFVNFLEDVLKEEGLM